ncbi:alpha/beta fold hydrolase [Candidatus Woesearchaeota archaeon]|nr:alpha/beta fold hydrolase [Candidatus Woesearchaeota archaeon]
MQIVNMQTEDSLNIVGDFFEGNNKGIILLHMFQKTKLSWRNFAEKLNKEGYTVLAIDFRGHGESDDNWKNFVEKDFNNMIEDVKAAKAFLRMYGIKDIGIIGASIGANIALNYGMEDEDVRFVILLSPGMNYKGISLEESDFDRPILIVASKDDTQSFNDSKEIFENINSKDKQIELFDNAGHGTDMFKDSRLEPLLLEFVKKNI